MATILKFDRILFGLALLITMGRPASATMLPTLESSEKRVSFAVGSWVLAGDASFDWRPMDGLSIGMATFFAPGVLMAGGEDFVATRVAHRLWQGPGGTALGYVFSFARNRNYSRGQLVSTQLQVQPALAMTIPLWFLPDAHTVRLRLTYGPEFELARQRTQPWVPLPIENEEPTLPSDDASRPLNVATGPRALEAVPGGPTDGPWLWWPETEMPEWVPNVEFGIDVNPSLEIVLGGGGYLGARVRW